MDSFSRLCIYNYFLNFEKLSTTMRFRAFIEEEKDFTFMFSDKININFIEPKYFYKEIIENFKSKNEKKNLIISRQLNLAREFLNDKINAAELLTEVVKSSCGLDNLLCNSVNRLLCFYTSSGFEADAGIHPTVLETLRWIDADYFPANRCDAPENALNAMAYLDNMLAAHENVGERIDGELDSLLRDTLHSDNIIVIENLAGIFSNGTYAGMWYHAFTACAFIVGLKRCNEFANLDRFYESINKWKANDAHNYNQLYGKMCGLGRTTFHAHKRECVNMLFRIVNDSEESEDWDHHSYGFVKMFANTVRDTYADNKQFIISGYYGANCDKEKNRIFGLLCAFDADDLLSNCNFIVNEFMENK
ncbi:hypothetical protein [Orgyia leucostigma nucleopolyhedrovirus]|uniref:Uncharacterized protein n=1 Tax=Orgyia leucostigma nucleopolyhedrovirus TaxID=490711 RepID=B0FDR5_9ABAC|nr:hypothetical protein [Orgyia leucostigma nucleopolyhedrovirus]ABY65773.1 hypothetical protein [Orgyia leucostigma nucleopolyhedrovirus]